MKKAILNSVKTLVTIMISIFLLNSCTEEFDYGTSEDAVETINYSDVLQISAKVYGTVNTDNGANLYTRGICYDIDSNPTIYDLKKSASQSSLGGFSCSLTDLSPSTTYYARAYATNSYGTAYGDNVRFTTQAATIPIIASTTTASSIKQTSANSGGLITNNGASKITSRGVCYSKTRSIPTISDSKTTNGTGIGQFTSPLTNLSPSTKYYIRAYATNSVGTAYGDVKSFTTTSATIPVVSSTTTPSSISLTTAVSGGNITRENGSTIISRGVCWSNTTSSPTIYNYKTVDSKGLGTFTSSLTSLAPGTTYYVRAYATNGIGTAYGPVTSFRTLSATIPTGVTTNSIQSITQKTATSGGNITNDGGATITSRGVCWSNTTSSPTIYNSKTVDGSGTGTFTSSLTGLSANTTYYVRAYASNSAGTAYGTVVSFKTTSTLTVGQSYQGGIIAYIFQSGDSGYVSGETHGLIVSNQTYSSQWGCSGTSISTGYSIGTGQNNTTSIVNGCSTSNIAARLCNDLDLGGYSDWYLPSYYELQKLYINKGLIGGFSNTYYWSSSQSNSTYAYSIYFYNGGASTRSKTSTAYVKAIRKF